MIGCFYFFLFPACVCVAVSLYTGGLVGCGGRRGDGRDLDPINSPVQSTGPNSVSLSTRDFHCLVCVGD